MWKALKGEAYFLRSHCLADSSWRTRRSQWKHYYHFCQNLGVNPLPCSIEVCCMYIAYMAHTFRYVSIVNYVSAVRGLHRWFGYAPPPTDCFLINATLAGARRLLGDTQFSSDPLLPSHLRTFRSILNLSLDDDFVFWCAVNLAFRGLLRKSSVCKGPQNLRRCDIEFFDWGRVISLHKSKTIQFSERIHQIPVSRVKGALCVMTLLEIMVRRIRAAPHHALFGMHKKNVYHPITYEWFSTKLKSCVARAGLKGKYTSHSLRRGGATALSLVGVPLHQIQKTGDWKSMSVLLYLSSPLDYRISHEIGVGKHVVEL